MPRVSKVAIGPTADPIRARGTAVTYWSPYWQRWVTRAVVKPTATPSAKQLTCRRIFADTQQLIKRQPAELQLAAADAAKGTKFFARDLMTMAALGTLYTFQTADGQVWAGVRTMYPDIQSMLSTIGTVKGSFIVPIVESIDWMSGYMVRTPAQT